MSNVRFTYTALRRHRGDGRAIYDTRTKRVDLGDSKIATDLEQQTGLTLSPFLASFAAMYGTRTHQFRQMAMQTKKHPRDVSHGPFHVVLDKKKRHHRNKLGEFQQGYKVINKLGERVHRGTKGSCEHVADQLNLEHCKWLMLPDSDDRYIAFDAQVAINRLIDSQVMNTMNPQWKMPP